MGDYLGSLSLTEIQRLLAGPAGPAPPGQVALLGGRPGLSTSTIIEVSITLFLSTGVISIRLFTQYFMSNGLLPEDYVIIIGYIFEFIASMLQCFDRGAGHHAWDLTLREFSGLQKTVFIFCITYNISLAAVKSAILLQFTRIIAPYRANRSAWFVCWICIVANLTFSATSVLLQIFHCSPIEKTWTRFEAGHCIDVVDIYKAMASFNIVSDISILIIPMPIIFWLNMSLRKKLCVAAVFATGLLACVCSILRAYYTWRTFDSPDMSYIIRYLGLWCVIEICAGFTVFCVPVFPKFYHEMRQKTQGKQQRVKSPGSDDSGKGPELLRPSLYEMPSLASFEERGRRVKISGVCLSAVDSTDQCSDDWQCVPPPRTLQMPV